MIIHPHFLSKKHKRIGWQFYTGFLISFVKKFRTWPKSPNFAKFRPKFIFRLFLKILLNIFKLLFPKFSNFGGGGAKSPNFAKFRRRMMGKCVKTKPRSVMFRECSLQDRLSPTPIEGQNSDTVLGYLT